MKSLVKSIKESKEQYLVYHDTYTSAIQAAIEYAERKGFVVDEDDAAMEIGIKSSRPKGGRTEKMSISLYKGEKLQKKCLQIQVTDLGKNNNNYELNCYIN